VPEEPNIQPQNENDEPDYHRDDDVPFHLPMAEDDDYAGPHEDTDDMPAVTAPSESIIRPGGDRAAHNMPTMPIPREPGMKDPKQTVTNPRDAGQTVRNTPVRPEDMNLPSGGPSVPHPTAPRPAASDARYQNPRQYPTPNQQQGPSYPAPQQGSQNRPPARGKKPPSSGAKGQRPVRRARNGSRRWIGCLPNGCLLIGGGIFVTFCGGLTLILLVRSEERRGG